MMGDEQRKKTLRELREEKGWKREDLTGKLGVTYSTVVNLETGRHKPRIDLALKIAELFKVPVESIAWGKSDAESDGSPKVEATLVA